MNGEIISFTDKKKEIERQIEKSLTDEELNMDYYRAKLRKMEDRLNIAFIKFQFSAVLFLVAILILDVKYRDCNMGK